MDRPCQHISGADSNIFRSTFAINDKMRDIMSDVAYEKRLVEVEVTLAQVQARLGIIPSEAAQAITAGCKFERLDRPRLREETQLVGLPIWGLTRQLAEMAGLEDAGRYVHWGLNTHDIMDLAQALQMKQAIAHVEGQLNQVQEQAIRLIREHRHTPMISRTHLQHGLPTTFGYRVAVWLSGLDRHVQRLAELKPRALLAQVGGASGTLASLSMIQPGQTDPDGLRVTRELVAEMDLYETPIPWHAARDGLAETATFLALLGGTLAKIAMDVC